MLRLEEDVQKKYQGKRGFGGARHEKDDIRHNAEFYSRNPQWFFPCFFGSKKAGGMGKYSHSSDQSNKTAKATVAALAAPIHGLSEIPHNDYCTNFF